MKLNKFLALLLSVAMLLTLGLGALAEEAADPTATDAAATLTEDTVLATVNGEDLTWGDIILQYNSNYSQYGYYIDDAAIKTIAMQESIDRLVMLQKAKELSLDSWTDEEKAQAETDAKTTWEGALDSYVTNSGLAEDATDADKQAKREEGNAAFLSEGYSVERLAEYTRQNAILTRVFDYLTEQSTPTAEAVQAKYDARLVDDQALYENDASAYTSTLNAGQVTPLYRPAGMRQVKHILLGVDDTLLATYTDLLARLEEQADADASQVQSGEANVADATPEVSADATTEPEATEAPVTQADVDVAKAAILDSLKDKIDDINTRFAAGEDFNVLIDEYNTDSGMSTDEGKAAGYIVSKDSTGYIPEFVTGTFSIAAPGEISAPVLGMYGVHIIYYVADVPAGPVELSEELKAELSDAMTTEGMQATYQAWLDAAVITYTGVVQSYDELVAEQSDGDAVADTTEPEATTEP